MIASHDESGVAVAVLEHCSGPRTGEPTPHPTDGGGPGGPSRRLPWTGMAGALAMAVAAIGAAPTAVAAADAPAVQDRLVGVGGAPSVVLPEQGALAAVASDDDGTVLAATSAGVVWVVEPGAGAEVAADLPGDDIVGVAPAAPTGGWVAGAAGSVQPFGGAPDLGGLAGPLNAPVVGIEPTPSGAGYWLVAADGGVFGFGDAGFHGSTGAIVLNAPITDLVATATGQGYWLVAVDGGMFAFGDAHFAGSAAAVPLNAPIVAGAATAEGDGYWLVASDGGVFTFGGAGFWGAAVAEVDAWRAPGVDPRVTGLAPTPSGDGYTLSVRTTTAPPTPFELIDPERVAQFDRLAQCESGGDWSIASGNGYFGGLQFKHSTWVGAGGTGRADQASREEQIVVADRLQADVGWGAWPACSRRLGLR